MSLEHGEMIIRNGLSYPEGALVVDGFDEEGRVLAHPLDAEIQYRISSSELARFDVVIEDEQTRSFDQELWHSFMSGLE